MQLRIAHLLAAGLSAALVPAQSKTQSAARPIKSFTGEWSTTLGPLTLEQTGEQVQGTYTHVKIETKGSIKDKTLTISFSSGRGTFTLSEDGETLIGSFRATNGQTRFWGGYRIRPAIAERKAGEITSGQTKSWLNYHLRVPESYSTSKKYPAIAFLHGSNMTSRDYINTIARRWPDIAKKYILVGLDGEKLSSATKPGRRAYNYSYVEFAGHMVGIASRFRQSPVLVAEALGQLGRELKITRWFLGGHSQGGFLTYAVHMFYPGRAAGIFPMSCNLLVQCAPHHFKAAGTRRLQREVAIAIIHGENDPVVGIGGGQACYRAMIEGGFPTVHFFKHPTAAHRFAHLPVREAIRWLEAQCSDEPTSLLVFADAQISRHQYRDASAALLKLKRLGMPADLVQNVEALWQKIESRAGPKAGELDQAISQNFNSDWIEDFLEFRQQFAFTTVAKPAMGAYAALRMQHEKPAAQLVSDARRASSKEQRNAKYRELLDNYYASRWYELVKSWIDD